MEVVTIHKDYSYTFLPHSQLAFSSVEPAKEATRSYYLRRFSVDCIASDQIVTLNGITIAVIRRKVRTCTVTLPGAQLGTFRLLEHHPW